jgi:hypoxanthine phosphoribosyltransferase
MSGAFECELMTWELFDKLAKNVSTSIIAEGYKPDFIVGLARGGWILSRVLCDYLGVKDLVSLKVEHWGITATPDGKAQIKYAFDIDLTGRYVLVVDDITDTGESMKVAVDYVKSKNPLSIKTAALRHIEGSKFIPDYYGEVISWRWVIFPWNFVEDMCNILPRASEGTDSLEEVKQRLKERYNIDLSIGRIKEINAEIDRRTQGTIEK